PLARRPRLAHASGRRPRPARGLGPLPHPAPASERARSRMTARLELTRAAVGLLMALAFAWALYFLVDLLNTSALNGTLGYDYRAYDLAVDRLFSGQPLYDATATEFGPFGL